LDNWHSGKAISISIRMKSMRKEGKPGLCSYSIEKFRSGGGSRAKRGSLSIRAMLEALGKRRSCAIYGGKEKRKRRSKDALPSQGKTERAEGNMIAKTNFLKDLSWRNQVWEMSPGEA